MQGRQSRKISCHAEIHKSATTERKRKKSNNPANLGATCSFKDNRKKLVRPYRSETTSPNHTKNKYSKLESSNTMINSLKIMTKFGKNTEMSDAIRYTKYSSTFE